MEPSPHLRSPRYNGNPAISDTQRAAASHAGSRQPTGPLASRQPQVGSPRGPSHLGDSKTETNAIFQNTSGPPLAPEDAVHAEGGPAERVEESDHKRYSEYEQRKRALAQGHRHAHKELDPSTWWEKLRRNAPFEPTGDVQSCIRTAFDYLEEQSATSNSSERRTTATQSFLPAAQMQAIRAAENGLRYSRIHSNHELMYAGFKIANHCIQGKFTNPQIVDALKSLIQEAYKRGLSGREVSSLVLGFFPGLDDDAACLVATTVFESLDSWLLEAQQEIQGRAPSLGENDRIKIADYQSRFERVILKNIVRTMDPELEGHVHGMLELRARSEQAGAGEGEISRAQASLDTFEANAQAVKREGAYSKFWRMAFIGYLNRTEGMAFESVTHRQKLNFIRHWQVGDGSEAAAQAGRPPHRARDIGNPSPAHTYPAPGSTSAMPTTGHFVELPVDGASDDPAEPAAGGEIREEEFFTQPSRTHSHGRHWGSSEPSQREKEAIEQQKKQIEAQRLQQLQQQQQQ